MGLSSWCYLERGWTVIGELFSCRSWGACCTAVLKSWGKSHGSSLMKSTTWEMQVCAEFTLQSTFWKLPLLMRWNQVQTKMKSNSWFAITRTQDMWDMKKSVFEVFLWEEPCSAWSFQSVVWCGRKPSFFFLITCITSSFPLPSPMPDSLLSGSATYTSRYGIC